MSVTVTGVTKRFSGRSRRAAVAGVSFEAPNGLITALLGPSGCGKTTLLRLIAGLERPDSGSISILGNDVTDAPASSRGAGLVFQNYALFRHMTVAKNVGFGLRIRGVDQREITERVDELLSLVQLEGFGPRFPSQLSGGQRQRVALARALAVRPSVLLLDEPFGALDAQVRVELREFLGQLLDKARVTTLFVTHDQQEALELASHVVLLHEGRVLQAGNPSRLYDTPACAEVAAFLGGTNVLTGSVARGRADLQGLEIAVPESMGEGSDVEAYVRPSDVRLTRASSGDAHMPAAHVERITRAGPQVKVELVLASGLPLTALLPKADFDALALQRGEVMLVELAEPKVFPLRKRDGDPSGAPAQPTVVPLKQDMRQRVLGWIQGPSRLSRGLGS
jgi:sulfate transport system ATP-binding protein